MKYKPFIDEITSPILDVYKENPNIRVITSTLTSLIMILGAVQKKMFTKLLTLAMKTRGDNTVVLKKQLYLYLFGPEEINGNVDLSDVFMQAVNKTPLRSKYLITNEDTINDLVKDTGPNSDLVGSYDECSQGTFYYVWYVSYNWSIVNPNTQNRIPILPYTYANYVYVRKWGQFGDPIIDSDIHRRISSFIRDGKIDLHDWVSAPPRTIDMIEAILSSNTRDECIRKLNEVFVEADFDICKVPRSGDLNPLLFVHMLKYGASRERTEGKGTTLSPAKETVLQLIDAVVRRELKEKENPLHIELKRKLEKIADIVMEFITNLKRVQLGHATTKDFWDLELGYWTRAKSEVNYALQRVIFKQKYPTNHSFSDLTRKQELDLNSIIIKIEDGILTDIVAMVTGSTVESLQDVRGDTDLGDRPLTELSAPILQEVRGQAHVRRISSSPSGSRE